MVHEACKNCQESRSGLLSTKLTSIERARLVASQPPVAFLILPSFMRGALVQHLSGARRYKAVNRLIEGAPPQPRGLTSRCLTRSISQTITAGYHGAIKACENAGQWEEATSLLQRMRQDPVAVVTWKEYNAAILACCRAQQSVAGE